MCSSSHFPVSLPFCETCNSWTDWQLASCSVTTASDKVVSDENCQDCAGKYLLSFFCPLSIPPFLTHITCLNTTPYCTHAHMHSHTSIDYLMTKAAEERTFFPSLSLASWGGGAFEVRKKAKEEFYSQHPNVILPSQNTDRQIVYGVPWTSTTECYQDVTQFKNLYAKATTHILYTECTNH